MADYISMKQVPGGTVTAVDDRILYDYAINSGIIYGCEISYTGNNMIHINAGYGIIKGGLFEMEDHTEYVDYSESATGTNGQIYLKFDAAAEDKIKIVKQTSDTLHPMTQDANANYDNGVYEIQLCTFRATTTALTNVTQTFVKSTIPIDVINTLEGIMANTDTDKAAGALAVKQLNNNLTWKKLGEAQGNGTKLTLPDNWKEAMIVPSWHGGEWGGSFDVLFYREVFDELINNKNASCYMIHTGFYYSSTNNACVYGQIDANKKINLIEFQFNSISKMSTTKWIVFYR